MNLDIYKNRANIF